MFSSLKRAMRFLRPTLVSMLILSVALLALLSVGLGILGLIHTFSP